MLIRIATRKSALALWQANHVAAALGNLGAVDAVELVPLTTLGDETLDRSLQKIGGKGLFIKELEVAMNDGRADIAVHSMKDVPAEMPVEFCVAAVLERASPADALAGRDGMTLLDLPANARIGSSSLRRQAQLKMLRSDLVVEPLRGNVNTRLAKLGSGNFDAIVLAAAGLERLGLQHHVSQVFTSDEMLPAAAQGVIGIECHADRAELHRVLVKLNHEATEQTTRAERAIARILQASCQSPVAAHASIRDGKMTLTALVALPDGSRSLRDDISGVPDDATKLGEHLAARLLKRGARELLDIAGSSHG